MLNPLTIQDQPLFATARQRIEESYTFYVTTIATTSAVCDDNMIKRTIFSAASGQTNAYHLNTFTLNQNLIKLFYAILFISEEQIAKIMVSFRAYCFASRASY